MFIWVATYSIASVTQALEELNCQLRGLLYGEGICDRHPYAIDSSSDGSVHFHGEAAIEPFEGLLTFQDTDVALVDARQRIGKALTFLRQAAATALEVESRGYSELDFEDVQGDSLHSCLMETYSQLIPEGIDKR